ncbi:MAG: SDR family oxidoreductase [Acidimicrobiia bacterium]|nr:SDR family oxidoreductase [Acidimicrobiia bacterium]
MTPAAVPPPRTDLDGKVALVTGSSRGLGAAIARRLGAAGADVIVTYRRREDEAEAVAEALRAGGTRCDVMHLDMGEIASIDAVFDEVAANAGHLDVFVANAAATSFRTLMDAEPRHVERTFAISVTGFLHAVQRAVPLMERRGGGRVVAVSGADTQMWIPAHGILGAAKAAMETLVRYLQCELGERNVTVVGVNPGWIDGDSLQMMLGPLYERAAGLERLTHPLRRTCSPDDMAEAVALLCTDAATWFGGNTVVADGAGGFAFCGRYSMMAGAMPQATVDALTGDAPAPSSGTGTDLADGEAPSVPRF